MATEALAKTLAERGNQYEGHGGFANVATVAQDIKCALSGGDRFDRLTDPMLEALSQIASKMARIVNGNPCNSDSWHDIAGYATLVEKSLFKPVVADKQGVHWQPTRPFDERWDSPREINLIDY